MSNRTYSPEERTEFAKLAGEIGLVPAMQELGYPGSWNTAKKWCDKAGVEVTLDALQRRAKSYDIFYGNQEKLLAAQALLNRIYAVVEQDQNLSPEELNKLATAAQKVIQTLALIEGTATGRTETIQTDKTDVELLELLNEQRARNADSAAHTAG